MGLESATFINQLVASNPTGSDGKAQGDDHLRLIKNVLQNSFPNLTGAVTMTQAQLNAVGAPGALNAPGMVTMWWGAEANIPLGWKLCNGVGTISTGSNVPDLRDKFVVGAGSTYALAASGGATTHLHTATLNIGGHVLTTAEMPSHNHASNVNAFNFRGSLNDAVTTSWAGVGGGSPTGNAGGNAAHTHENSTATVAASSNLPPYVALFYIIKN